MEKRERKVTYIPADPFKSFEKDDEMRKRGVAIYCRVSTTEQKQLHSLSAQISGLIKYLKHQTLFWGLEDVYVDIYSGIYEDRRPEFNRMLADVKTGKIKTIVTKSIQRFGRNTKTVLKAIDTIRDAGGHVIFAVENIDTLTRDNDFIIAVLEGVAQEESQIKSENIRWGIQKSLMNKDSRYYNRACYGYHVDEAGKLVIDADQEQVVKDIFGYYLRGFSIVGIKRALELRGIPSPTGKEKWAQRTIQNILTNEKYIGDVEVLRTKKTSLSSKRMPASKGDKTFINTNHHPAIIIRKVFDDVQDLMRRRSSIEIGPDGKKTRKKTHYSSIKDYKEIAADFSE